MVAMPDKYWMSDGPWQGSYIGSWMIHDIDKASLFCRLHWSLVHSNHRTWICAV